ncbi:MAG TPA: CBS domain-containing protein [Gaiellaceae bacterium]|jgi:CBS domain-containing protein
MAIADVMSVRLVSVEPGETGHVAVARMLESGVGAVLVCEANRLVGIFTERDVLRLAGESPGLDLQTVRVGDVMTTELATISPDDDVLAAARLMGERRIRHLPVLQDGNVLGLIGIRDVMRSLVELIWRAHDEGARETARELLRR